MTKQFILSAIVGFTLCMNISDIHAQAKLPAKAAVKDSAQRIQLSVKYGPYANEAKAFVTDLVKLLPAAELRITDNKGNAWTVISYRLGYRKKEVSDDYKTGKRKTVFTFNAATITNGKTKLPESWQKELTESLQASEEILFENVIVQNIKTKKMMLAPALKILVI